MDEISISNLNLNIFKTVIEYFFLMALLIEYFRDKKKKKIIDYHPGQKKIVSILGGPKITVFRFSLFISLSMYLNQTHWPYDMLQNQISCP